MNKTVTDPMGGRWIREAGGWFSTRWPIRFIRRDSDHGRILDEIEFQEKSGG
jgi:hypothetical protein